MIEKKKTAKAKCRRMWRILSWIGGSDGPSLLFININPSDYDRSNYWQGNGTRDNLNDSWLNSKILRTFVLRGSFWCRWGDDKIDFMQLHGRIWWCVYVQLNIYRTSFYNGHIIYIFNYYISIAKNLSLKKRFLEMALISLGIAALTFGIGYLARTLFHIEI